MPDSIKIRFKKLSLAKKIVFFGSALVIISVFLPWYSEVDKFNTGDSFLGISGPLYLAGLLLFLSAVASLGIIVLKLMEKSVPKLPLKEEHFYIFNGALSLLMLIISVSVYFHPSFGINLTDKSAGVGLFLGFIGAGLVLLGAFLDLKKKEVSFETEGHTQPLVNIEAMERSKADLELRKDITIEQAMTGQVSKKEEAKPWRAAGDSKNEATKSWGPVQESINKFLSDTDNTKDLK